MRGLAPILADVVVEPEGPAAREIDRLWWFLLVVGTAVFLLVAVLLAAGLARRRGEDRPSGSVRPWLLGGGVLLPGIVIGAVLVATVQSMRGLPDEDPDAALTIEIIGHQWWWEVRYPDHDVVTANEVHIPAGEPVQLELRSADVIHSFWVPALAGKKDLLPDASTSLVIEADRPGRYRGQCAEFCGLQHANMGIVVEADEPEEFAGWLTDQAASASPPAGTTEQRGAELLQQAGCGACHTIRGTDAAGRIGPDLTHVASRETLAAGTIANTVDELATWISDPHSIKPGTAMEPADLTDDELAAVVAYLRVLR